MKTETVVAVFVFVLFCFVCLLLLLFCFCFCLHQIMELDTERRWAGLFKLENQYSRINVRDALPLTDCCCNLKPNESCSGEQPNSSLFVEKGTKGGNYRSQDVTRTHNIKDLNRLRELSPGVQSPRAYFGEVCEGPRVSFALVKLP